MNTVIEIRPAEVIAAEINQIKRSTAQYVLLQSIEIGRLLCEAKQTVPFGDWGGWLEANCAYSQSNANNLMRIYKEYGEDAQLSFIETNKLELYGNLNRSQAVALLALPSDEREEFVKSNDVESMSISELEEKIKAVKEEAEAQIKEKDLLLGDKTREAEDAYKKLHELDEKARKAEKEASDLVAKALKSQQAEEKAKANAEKAQQKLTAAENECGELKKKIEELESAKPEISAEEKAEIEAAAEKKFSAEIEKLINEKKTVEDMLRTQNEKLKAASDSTVQKFAVLFENFSETYNKLRSMLHSMDSDNNTKFKGAMTKALERMREEL